MIVLAVIAAAAGSILRDLFGFPYAVGVIGMMASVGFLVFRGSDTIERFLTGWSVLLYVVYATLFLWCFVAFGESIRAGFASGGPSSGWALGGVKYAAYNLAAVPLVLFTTRHLETRREAVGAGLLAGPIAIIPGLLFLVCMVGQYPAILEREVPANYLLELLDARWFQLTFQVVLFGTLVETGTGMIHAINERIDSVYRQRERHMPLGIRPAVAIGLLVLGTLLARVGIIDLIARGYGTLTWFFLLVYVIPILTLGVWRLRNASMQRDTHARDG